MNFRQWVQEIWFQHIDELDAWEHQSPKYSPAEYFNRYKWWLKREYKHQSKTESA